MGRFRNLDSDGLNEFRSKPNLEIGIRLVIAHAIVPVVLGVQGRLLFIGFGMNVWDLGLWAGHHSKVLNIMQFKSEAES